MELEGSAFHGPWRGPWVSGGFGYLVSRKAVKILADCQDPKLTDEEVFEDKVVADILRAGQITPVSMPGPPWWPSVRQVLAGVALSSHPVQVKTLRRAYAKLVKRPRPVLRDSPLKHGVLPSGLRRLATALGLSGLLPKESKPNVTFHQLGGRPVLATNYGTSPARWG